MLVNLINFCFSKVIKQIQFAKPEQKSTALQSFAEL